MCQTRSTQCMSIPPPLERTQVALVPVLLHESNDGRPLHALSKETSFEHLGMDGVTKTRAHRGNEFEKRSDVARDYVILKEETKTSNHPKRVAPLSLEGLHTERVLILSRFQLHGPAADTPSQ